jgi:hypothetical protein
MARLSLPGFYGRNSMAGSRWVGAGRGIILRMAVVRQPCGHGVRGRCIYDSPCGFGAQAGVWVCWGLPAMPWAGVCP